MQSRLPSTPKPNLLRQPWQPKPNLSVSEAEAPLAVSAAIAEQAEAEAEHTEGTAAASPESTPAEVQPIAYFAGRGRGNDRRNMLAESRPPVAAAAMVAETAHEVFEAEAQPVEPAAEASQQLPVEEAVASVAAVAVAETAPEAPVRRSRVRQKPLKPGLLYRRASKS